MDVKRVFACAALLTGLLFFNGRLSAAVESDVVGYQAYKFDEGTYLLSIPFETLDGKEAGFPIQNIAGTFNSGTFSGDKLLVWDRNTGGYITYRYSEEGWKRDNVLTEDVILPSQSAFLVSRKGNTSFTVAGKVVSEDVTTIPVEQGVNFTANPYPTKISIKDIKGTLTAGTFKADRLLRWSPEQNDYITYRCTKDGWKKSEDTTETSDELSAGEGFILMKVATDGEIVISSPVK